MDTAQQRNCILRFSAILDNYHVLIQFSSVQNYFIVYPHFQTGHLLEQHTYLLLQSGLVAMLHTAKFNHSLHAQFYSQALLRVCTHSYAQGLRLSQSPTCGVDIHNTACTTMHNFFQYQTNLVFGAPIPHFISNEGFFLGMLQDLIFN